MRKKDSVLGKGPLSAFSGLFGLKPEIRKKKKKV